MEESEIKESPEGDIRNALVNAKYETVSQGNSSMLIVKCCRISDRGAQAPKTC